VILESLSLTSEYLSPDLRKLKSYYSSRSGKPSAINISIAMVFDILKLISNGNDASDYYVYDGILNNFRFFTQNYERFVNSKVGSSEDIVQILTRNILE